MTETARLVVAADSSQVRKATEDLEKLAKSGKKTEQATDALQDEINDLTKALFPATKRLEELGRLQDLLTQKFKKGDLSAEQYQDAMKRLTAEKKRYTDQLNRVDSASGKALSTFDRLKRAAVALGAVYLAQQGLRAIIANTIEAEQVQAQLEARLKSTAGAAGLTLPELNNMAQGLQRVTTYGDEAIGTVQSVLLTFTKIGRDNFGGATEAVLNLATALGTDLNGAAIQVGKALNDPVKGVTALGRAGVQFSEDQKKLIKSLVETGDVAGAQTIILRELETQMGGSARAARETLGGALQAAKEAFGDLLEGDTGSDGIRGTVGAINDLTATMQSSETKAGFQAIVQGLASVANFAAQTITMLAGVGSAVNQLFTDLEKKDMQGLINRELAITDDLRALDKGGMGLGARSLFVPGTHLNAFQGKDENRVRLERELQIVRDRIDELNATERGRQRAADSSGSSGSPNGRGRGVRGTDRAATDGMSEAVEKLTGKLRDQAAAYGLSESAQLKLEMAQDLGKATTEAEREAITSAYGALISKVEAEEAATAAKQGSAAADRDAAKAKREEAQALQEFNEATGSLNSLLESQASTLGGPLLQVAQTYANTMTELLMTEQKLLALGKLDLEQQAKLKVAREQAEEIRRKDTEAIQAQLEPGAQLLDDLQFELSLIGMTNSERATAIQLRGLETDQILKYGDAIRAANEKMQELMDQEQQTEAFKGQFTEAFASIINGSKSAGDALDDLLAGILDIIAQNLAKKLTESLFSAMDSGASSGGGGGGGGFWAGISNMFMSLFAGGKASGGRTQAGKMYRVNEFEPEMVSVGNKDYLMMGSKGGDVGPMPQGDNITLNQTINVPISTERRTAKQVGAASQAAASVFRGRTR